MVSLSNIDPSMEEMAQNMGCHGFRLFRRITLPLMLPGFVAGSLLTFIRAIDDLGTPLMLNYKNLLATQAYLRITTVGMDDVDGYVVCVVLVVLHSFRCSPPASISVSPSMRRCSDPLR